MKSVLVCLHGPAAEQAVSHAAAQLGLGDVVATAVGGSAALARVERQPADLVLVDTAAVRPDTEVIIIDEAQFFDEELVRVANRWADEGRTVICAGLDMDRYGRPFGIMPALAATAEEAVKLRAICICCGEEAWISYGRATTTTELKEVGGADKYEARCRRCARLGPAAERTKG
ncbi:MAG: hypothetical protein K6U08_07145 [Firmicutes bacterium]|nr:hypothetical protein [Bacillota bacterium]